MQTSGGDATGGRLAWKVDQASATTAAQFANPTMTADYHFCVYAGTATMAIGEATVAADPVKWTAVDSRRYVYRDRDGSAMGITKIGLRSGGAGKGRVIVRARGEHLLPVLRDPAFPLVVQLVNSDNGRCWGASYNAADVVTSTGDQFKAQTQ